MSKYDSWLALARRIKLARRNLPPERVLYQKIDGAKRTRSELICLHHVPNDLLLYQGEVIAKAYSIKELSDALDLFELAAQSLREHGDVDLVMVSGPQRHLAKDEDVDEDAFFTYVYYHRATDKQFSESYKNNLVLVKEMSNGFRASMLRQFKGGYQPLLPGIAINEDNRACHQKLGLKSVLKCNGTIFNSINALDLRCISTESNNAVNEEKLNTTLCYLPIFSAIIEQAVLRGIEFPIWNAEC